MQQRVAADAPGETDGTESVLPVLFVLLVVVLRPAPRHC